MTGRVPGPTNARAWPFARLADCQKNATGRAPVGVAIRIVIELARALDELRDTHDRSRISPPDVKLGYDGNVEVETVRTGASAAYRSPEEVSGTGIDGRSEVFSLGIMLWELLTGSLLFGRGDEAATAAAILHAPIADVRSLNAAVPPIVAEVLATALARDRDMRFDTAAALGKALAAARSSTEIREASRADVACWVAEQVPRDETAAIPDLASLGISDVPDLFVLNVPRAVPAPAPVQIAPPPPAFSPFDDDDDEMQIERGLSSGGTSPAPSRASAAAPQLSLNVESARVSSARRASSGLELGAPQRSLRTENNDEEDDVATGTKIGGWLTALALVGGAAATLVHFVHRAGGRPIQRLLPHAFDGTSANESGAIALVTLVVAIAIGFTGLRLRPRAWSIAAAGGALLLLALAMVTVTLASTGENRMPPDGALLVPYVAPAAVLLLALGLCGRAARILARASGARRLGGIPLAAIAGALAFVAFEMSRYAGPPKIL